MPHRLASVPGRAAPHLAAVAHGMPRVGDRLYPRDFIDGGARLRSISLPTASAASQSPESPHYLSSLHALGKRAQRFKLKLFTKFGLNR